MRFLYLLLAAPLLSGCATIFDPAPYSPNKDPAVIANAPAQSTPASILYFKDPTDAADKLQALANGYSDERDSIMRQQLIFDVPMIGLGAATIINPIFSGATKTTIALGLGAAGAAGLRTYFAPQTRVGAYNDAASSLTCASGVGRGIAPEYENISNYEAKAQALLSSIGEATALILGGQIADKNQAAALLVARDQAASAYGDLATAIGTAKTAAVHLQLFADAVIKGTNKTIISGAQNVDAALALLRAAPTSVTAPTTVTPTAPKTPKLGIVPELTVPERIAILVSEATEAEGIANAINGIWATLSSCAATS